MNLQHVVKLNHRLHEVKQSGPVLILGNGRTYGQYHVRAGKLVNKHVFNGKFRSEVAK
jgi:hypothetical protein